MAQPNTAKFSEFVILLGDGATPTEAFSIICGLTSKGLTITNNTQSTPVPDCSNEDLPAYEDMETDTQRFEVSGSGVWAKENHERILQWAANGTRKNIKLRYVNVAIGDTEYINGPAILTSLGHTVERGQKLRGELSISFAIKPTLVPKAA